MFQPRCTIHEVQIYIKLCGQSRVRTYVLVREQIYSLSPLTTRPSAQDIVSRRWDSNPRPADYKSAALPTELFRLINISTQKNSPNFWDGKGNGNLYLSKF